jgi:hypothetical protein
LKVEGSADSFSGVGGGAFDLELSTLNLAVITRATKCPLGNEGQKEIAAKRPHRSTVNSTIIKKREFCKRLSRQLEA